MAVERNPSSGLLSHLAECIVGRGDATDRWDALPDEWGQAAEGPGRHRSVVVRRSLGESGAWGAARQDAVAGVEHRAQLAVRVGKLAGRAQAARVPDDLQWDDWRSVDHWPVALCRPDADRFAARSYVGRESLDVVVLLEVFAQEAVERQPEAHPPGRVSESTKLEAAVE